MPYRINCELCGQWIEAQRNSRQYCGPCRPKAVFINNVIKSLNRAADASPLAVNDLIERRVEVDYHDPLRGAFNMLAGTQPLGVLTMLNIALSEYGMISWDGVRFELVRWVDRPGNTPSSPVTVGFDPAGSDHGAAVVMDMNGNVEQVISPEDWNGSLPNGRTFRDLFFGQFAPTSETDPRDVPVPQPSGLVRHSTTGPQPINSHDAGIYIRDPGPLARRRRGPMIYQPDPQRPNEFVHVGYANTEGDEIFGSA